MLLEGAMQHDLNSRDRTVIRAIVSEIVPEEHLKDFYKLMYVHGHNLSDTAVASVFKAVVFRNAAIVFASMKTWDSIPANVDNRVMDAAFLLAHCEQDHHMYQSLPEHAQRFFISITTKEKGPARSHTHLRTLNKMGFAPVHDMGEAVNKLNFSDTAIAMENRIQLVLSELEINSESVPFTITPDFEQPEMDFLRHITSPITKNIYGLEPCTIEIFLFWKVIFGESVVTDFLDRFAPLNTRIPHGVALDILEAWDTLKTYPADWILEMHLSSRPLEM